MPNDKERTMREEDMAFAEEGGGRHLVLALVAVELKWAS